MLMVIGVIFIRHYNKTVQLTHALRCRLLKTPVTVQPTSLHTANTSGCKSTGGLTNIVLYSEVLLSQKTRPDALLSLKFPQPKLPVKTLLGEEERE